MKNRYASLIVRPLAGHEDVARNIGGDAGPILSADQIPADAWPGHVFAARAEESLPEKLAVEFGQAPGIVADDLTVKQVNGIFQYNGDSDWFRVRLTAGTTYHATVGLFGGGGAVSLDVRLPSGEVLQKPIQFANYASFTAPVSGDYYVSVTGDGLPWSGNGSVNGFYSLSVSGVVDPIPGTVATTRSLAVGETQTITYNVSQSTNDDWFAVDLVAGQTYLLASSHITDRLYFVDGSGNLVAMEGVFSSGRQQVHFAPTATGRYYAGVSHSSSQYTLTLTTTADDHGDKPAGAGAMTVGAPAAGRWEVAGDDDAYAITLSAGASYGLSLQNLTDSSLAGYIRVLDQSGQQVWTSSGLISGAQSIFSAAATGTHYLVASLDAVSSPDPMNPRHLRGWDYAFSAALIANELPDNALTQGSLTVGGQTGGSWEAFGDRDWFKINMVAGQSYTLTLTSSQWNGMGLALYDAQGNQLDSVSGGSAGAYLHHSALATGTYYLSAMAGQSPAGSYTVAAAIVADDFASSATTTGLVTVNGTATGIWEANNDEDWFAINLTAGHYYAANLLDGQGGLVILDAQGKRVSFQNPFEVYFPVETSGTYYVAVQGVAGEYEFGVAEIEGNPDDYDDSAATQGLLRILVNGTSGADILTSSAEYETLNGLAGDDLFIAGGGFDIFSGGTGIDTLSYEGLGHAVEVSLLFGQTLVAGAAYDLLDGIENVTGTGFDDSLTGNGAANTLRGLEGADTLRGGSGQDNLIGGAGDDRVIGGAGDDLLDGGDGTDTASYAGTANGVTVSLAIPGAQNTIGAGLDRLVSIENLTGSDWADTLTGDVGGNVLDGGAGADTLIGGQGNDIFILDNANDVVIEGSGQGLDTVFTNAGYLLNDDIERVGVNGFSTTYAINLIGNRVDNELWGNDGANFIDGRDGVDVMYGFGGNDIYIVETVGDVVIELAGQGLDTIFTSISWTLDHDLERLGVNGFYTTYAITLTGNELANEMWGNDGANIIDGKAGADIMTGFGGNDAYFVDNANDIIIETGAGGTDIVFASANYALGEDVERLTVSDTSSTFAINLTGNAAANEISGNNGANVLSGQGGSDLLIGNGGADTFAFTSSIYAGSIDQILDFQAGLDKIGLGAGEFAGLVAGALAAGAFRIGSAAADADDRIIYDQTTGALYFDADGNGAGAQVQFANMSNGLSLTANDFTVI